MFFTKNTIIAGGSVILLGAVFLYFSVYYKDESLLLITSDVFQEMQLEGTVVSTESINIGFPFAGRVTNVSARTGDEVSSGDVLIRLDTSRDESEIKQLEAQIALEKIKLSQLLAGVLGKEADVLEAKAEETRIALENAKQGEEDLKRLITAGRAERFTLVVDYAHTVVLNADNALKALEGIYDDDHTFRDIFVVPESPQRSEAEWQMRFAQTALENIRKDAFALVSDTSEERVGFALSQFKTNCEVIRSLLQKTADLLDTARTVFGSPDVAGFRTTVAIQQAVINATQTALLNFEQDIASYTRESERQLNDMQGKVKQFTASLETAERELVLKRAVPGESETALLQAQIREIESRATLLREQVRRAEIRAPVKGVVMEIKARQGGTVKADEVALVLAPDSGSRIEGELTETAEFVKPGDEAAVSFADGRTFRAAVGARDDKNVVLYLQEDSGSTPLPKRAEVTIYASIRTGALMVPAEFIFEQDGIQNVYVLKDGNRVRTPVLTGVTWEGAVELTEGVSAGDRIVKP